VGFGRVGSVAGGGLHASGAPLVVIEDSDHSIAAARAQGIEVVVGNAASADVLKLANIGAAKCLMIAIPNGFEAGTVCETGRKVNPAIRIIARAHSEEEEAHLRGLGADTVIMGEREIGLGMLAWLRGERNENTIIEAAPPEPKLPPAENILEAVAADPAADSGEMPVATAVAAVVSDIAVVETTNDQPETIEWAETTVLTTPVVESTIETPAEPSSELEQDNTEAAVFPPAEEIALPTAPSNATDSAPRVDAPMPLSASAPPPAELIDVAPAIGPVDDGVEAAAQSEIDAEPDDLLGISDAKADEEEESIGLIPGPSEDEMPEMGELISPDGTVAPIFPVVPEPEPDVPQDLPEQRSDTVADPASEDVDDEPRREEPGSAPPVLPEPKN
jgi:CPA2 family monovalent cation:H+ antiporter-2